MRTVRTLTGLSIVALMLHACGSGNTACNLDTNEGCSDGKVCEQVQGGQPACFAPVQVQGRVFDLANGNGISNARVVAMDPNGTAISGVARTANDGSYTLRIPTERTSTGMPVSARFTLRADAQGYQTFPGGIRPPIPVDTTVATMSDGGTPATIMNATTDIGLIALPPGDRGIVTGRVEGNQRSGVLIVGGGSTAISDRDGTFTLFNVMPGSVTVRGYAQGVQFNPATVMVSAGMTTDNVVLSVSNTPLSTVSGSVNIVNAPGGSRTSVVLVVRETFNPTLERGEVPRGLRATNVSGAFTIENVPDGEYTVLAAFENDGLVRDPDPNIGGTQIVHITVPMGGSRMVTLPSAFKVTEALAVHGPGAETPEGITSAQPVFRWADDSSEDGYEIRVFDAFGNVVWENTMLPSVSGGGEVSVMYSGPPLQPGMYYQFRATSFRMGRNNSRMRAPISRTEDLRGVFFLQR